MNAPFSRRFSALAGLGFLVLPWIASTAAAQVQVMDRPYRIAAAQPALVTPIGAGGLLSAMPLPPGRPALTAPAAVVVAPPAVVIPTWEIQLADGSLSKALMRWSRVSGLPMLWEATKDLPAVNAKYVGEYLEVLEQVMTDSARSQYPLHACVYDNAVRVLHVSQSCLR